MSSPVRVRVAGARSYDVVIGRGVLTALAEAVPAEARQVAVIHPHHLTELAETVAAGLRTAGLRAAFLPVPNGESAKSAAVAAQCWSALGRERFTRTDVVVGLGGGATTDLAGFVAATWLRGVPVVHAPTTLLGMVDAAVGGKTAINTAEGKNLVGAFHEPAAVLCDLALLERLPARELANGLAEAVKCGFVADPAILERIEADPQAARLPAGSVLPELMERAVRVKARVVAADPRESVGGERAGREVLNYGHTLGHAVERLEGYRLRHGYAVAIGMVYAAELGRLAGRLDDETSERHRAVLSSLDLPTSYRADAWPALHEAIRMDKKARGDRLRFVVLEGLARPLILADPEPALLRAAYVRLVSPGGPVPNRSGG